MQYVTPSMQDMASLLYGGGNTCTCVGEGDKNACSYSGTGTAGCYAVGGDGHTCNAGSGTGWQENDCSAGTG